MLASATGVCAALMLDHEKESRIVSYQYEQIEVFENKDYELK